jgi:hypothetical protein
VFLLSTSSRPILGSTLPPIQWVPGVLSPGVKRPGHEADHSPPTSAEARNTGICTSTPIRLHGVLNQLSTGKPLPTISSVRSRDSSVGMATGYGLGWGSIPDGQDFLFSTVFRPAVGSTQPPIQWVPVLFPWCKALIALFSLFSFKTYYLIHYLGCNLF